MGVLPKRKPPEEAEIPTASMADIAFLLIIFFMVTTVFARDKGLKMLLPEKQSETVKIKSKKIIDISINDAGQIFFNDNPVQSPEELRQKIQSEIEKDPKKIVLIKTNVEAPYERMIQVLDVVKQLKVKAVALKSIRPEG